MSITFFEPVEGLPYVRRVARFANYHPQWGWGWREVARNEVASFIVADHDGPHRLPEGLPSEAVDPLTITDTGRGRKTARCVDRPFPPVPARVVKRRAAFLSKHPELRRWVERHRALMGLPR